MADDTQEPATSTPVQENQQVEKTQEQIDALVDETLAQDLPSSINQPPPEKKEDDPNEDEKEEPAEGEEEPIEDDEEKEEESEEEIDLPEEKEEEKKEEIEQPDPEGLFIEVEDAEGKKYKIQNETDLPEDFVPKNNRQVIEILNDLRKLDDQKAEQAKDAEVKAQEEQLIKERDSVLTGWNDEIGQLQQAGIIPVPKAKFGTKGWESDPAVVQNDSVFKYMIEQNKILNESGKAPITSYATALNLMNASETKKNDEQAIKDDNANAKAKAGLVGKTTAPSEGEPVYKAGSARTIDDIL